MNPVEQNLSTWKASLLRSIPVGGLISRNATVYKWKAPFRSWMLREAVSWRAHDLLAQSYSLHQQDHGLGARILLRSAFETLATLIYLNQLIERVVDGQVSFNEFGKKTSILLLGSRDKSTEHSAMNIVSVLEKCDKRYPGILQMYATLSESAHPNYEGLCWGYSKVDHDEYETFFSNRWMALHGERHLDSMDHCMEIFWHEYNEVWSDRMSKLEIWIEQNDAALEAAKGTNH